ncbi:hypothetical protein BJ878DRAFT_578831 [Calycina marina]|uniref:DNA repair metallo-beta-lactamase domain-containing protein n=1 Tax=Calycina marina TaxID=1763456 RepID=A0A9P8CBM3_9HELO|nr:hypothetical protein BJ878DRAFT_578831 [Calycina marina]
MPKGVYCSAATRELLLRLERYPYRMNIELGVLDPRKQNYKHLKDLLTLDCIYLDTSNTRPSKFPTKAKGLKELLTQVKRYPADTVFHFTAWTFGYEEVWMALSRALNSQIHVDKYRLQLYQSIRGVSEDTDIARFLSNDVGVLAGYDCGNSPQAGCLTHDINVRIHSCEKGMHCKNVNEKTVYILPIVARSRHGQDMGEIGIGGSGHDLGPHPELELGDAHVIDQFLGLEQESDDWFIGGFQDPSELPQIITFPYPRHSSYEEFCHLVQIFKPNDVYPCTVDEKNWTEDISMIRLFSDHYSGTNYRHDDEMREKHAEYQYDAGSSQKSTQTTERSESSQMLPPSSLIRYMATQGFGAEFDKERSDKYHSYIDRAHATDFANREQSQISANVLLAMPSQLRMISSPVSASQNLRWRAIEDGLNTGPIKRVHIGPDGSDDASSVRELTPTSSMNPGSSDDDVFSTENEEQFKTLTFFDQVDNISRCKSCGHETWGQFGACTGCEIGPEKDPYHEYLPAGNGAESSTDGESDYKEDYLRLRAEWDRARQETDALVAEIHETQARPETTASKMLK